MNPPLKSIPKTERKIGQRTKEESVAITLEYLASFIVWTERLTQDELVSLNSKIESLIQRFNTDNLNTLLAGVSKYLEEESIEADL